MNLSTAFLIGLTTGGLSCFAVQGGLLASVLDIKRKEKQVFSFLLAKIIAYTLLGFILGLLGASVSIPPKVQGFIQILIGIYMLVTAARLVNLHPMFKYFVITPPKFVFRFLRKQSQAALLGFLTVLIPCGITQAMMLVAASSGNPPWAGALMFFFILGTIPIFLVMGLATGRFLKHKAFTLIASVLILIIGLSSINSGQILRGSPHTFQNYWRVLTGHEEEIKFGNSVNIEVTNSGYQADVNTLKIGVPVRIIINSKNVLGCARAFTIPSLNLTKILPENGQVMIEFTPNKLGTLTYACSMGMYAGSFNVIK